MVSVSQTTSLLFLGLIWLIFTLFLTHVCTVLEQLQFNFGSGEEFDLETEENENANRMIKMDPILSEILMF